MRILKKILIGSRNLLLFLFVSSLLAVVAYKFIPVYYTPLMFIRVYEQVRDSKSIKLEHKWMPLKQIAQPLAQAVVASEDNLFLDHDGFDMIQIQKARADAEKGKRVRGASTISQQTAKNVFLWPGRTYLRKGIEAYFTVLIEWIWGKERIMEVYLNSIEMGDGIYGAEAVAQAHFKKPAYKLTKAEAALIAATLPNPRKFNSAKPSPYMLKRQTKIMSLMGKLLKIEMGYDSGDPDSESGSRKVRRRKKLRAESDTTVRLPEKKYLHKNDNHMSHFIYHDLGRIEYEKALERQTVAFNALLEAKAQGRTGENRLFFCEHQPVLTIGKSGKDTNLLIPKELLVQRGISFYHINRGGDITYHGPGQITGYPVFDLDTWKLGLKQYIDRLEETIIRFLAIYGIKGERLAGATGVWIDPGVPRKARKICAIGVKSSRFVTMHGFALNINTDLDYFSLINPCGFKDKGVTSLEKEMGMEQDFEEAKARLHSLFTEMFPE